MSFESFIHGLVLFSSKTKPYIFSPLKRDFSKVPTLQTPCKLGWDKVMVELALKLNQFVLSLPFLSIKTRFFSIIHSSTTAWRGSPPSSSSSVVDSFFFFSPSSSSCICASRNCKIDLNDVFSLTYCLNPFDPCLYGFVKFYPILFLFINMQNLFLRFLIRFWLLLLQYSILFDEFSSSEELAKGNFNFDCKLIMGWWYMFLRVFFFDWVRLKKLLGFCCPIDL